VADLAVLVGVARALKSRDYAEEVPGTGATSLLFCQIERRLAGVSSPFQPIGFRYGGADAQSGSCLTGGGLVLVVLGDGQGEGGRVDLQSEPVGRLDGVAVELHRLGAVTTDLHLASPEGIHIGARLAAAVPDDGQFDIAVLKTRTLRSWVGVATRILVRSLQSSESSGQAARRCSARCLAGS
jgi:hypothetical protein